MAVTNKALRLRARKKYAKREDGSDPLLAVKVKPSITIREELALGQKQHNEWFERYRRIVEEIVPYSFAVKIIHVPLYGKWMLQVYAPY